MNQDLLAQLMELMAALRMWLTNAPTDPGWWAELWPALVAAALAGLVAVGATAYVQFKLTTHQDEIEREREAEAERRAYTEEARQHVAVPLRETLSRIRRSELTPVDERVRGSVAELLRHRLAAYLPPGGDEIVERWDEAERAIGKADTGRNALRASIAEKRASMRASRTQDRGAAVDTRDLEADDVWRNLTE